MKAKLHRLFGIFVAFTILSYFMPRMPELARGDLRLDVFGFDGLEILRNLVEFGIGFLLTLTAYLAFFLYYPRQRFLRLGMAVSVAILICGFLGYLLASFMEGSPIRLSAYFRNTIFSNLLLVALAAVYYLVRYTQFTRLQQKEAEVQRRIAELAHLRSQVNPHFLFNNLNTIYSLIYLKSEQALPAVSALSDLLRYMLYEQADTVPIEKELVSIEKFIELQQLRFEKACAVAIYMDQDSLTGIMIPPLILMPFVENAFKHGDLQSDSTNLVIDISASKGGICFSCRNRIAKNRVDRTGGIGIENARKRLRLLFPDSHRLEINEVDGWFSVNLQLDYGK